MTQLNYDSFEHHPLSEKIVRIMQDRNQVDAALFFRLMVANYFAMAAATMRTMIQMPEGVKVPVNMYTLNLAPSGFGKSRSSTMMTKEVLNQFISRFTDETFLTQAEDNMPKLACHRAAIKGTDPDQELDRLTAEFARAGELMFCFNGGTPAGARQLRHKLLIAKAGAMNLIVDEVGLHLGKNSELVDVFMELYDGETGNALNKHTSDNPRNAELNGITPSNMLLFGTSNKLLDGASMEEQLLQMLESGFARRCFFGYVEEANKQLLNPQEMLERAKRAGQNTDLHEISDRMDALADLININKTLMVPDETALLLFQYKHDCEQRAKGYKKVETIRRLETEGRFFKTLKLAGVYAFIDDSPEITPDHLKSAIKIAEESGHEFQRLLKRDKPYVKLAKYISDIGEDVTHADLVEDLPFYPKQANQRNDMLSLAIAYGYKNNIIIKKSFQDGIEFLRGESLKETNLDEVTFSYSDDIAEGYTPECQPFDQLYKLTQAQGLHWANHHFRNGRRSDDNAEPGFNLVVIDVDGGATLEMARKLLKDYRYLLYTTKRHTPEHNRFRIVFPTSHELRLDAKDYKEFMSNIFQWLPFESDDGTGQRSKKWLSHAGHHEYNDGELLDVLPFIPKTTKNEERKNRLLDQQGMDNLERWVINNTGDGNRNKMLLRYAMILVDAGLDEHQIRNRVLDLNGKLPDKLDDIEIHSTIMVTVAKAIAKR